jgi:hypothetical protein
MKGVKEQTVNNSWLWKHFSSVFLLLPFWCTQFCDWCGENSFNINRHTHLGGEYGINSTFTAITTNKLVLMATKNRVSPLSYSVVKNLQKKGRGSIKPQLFPDIYKKHRCPKKMYTHFIWNINPFWDILYIYNILGVDYTYLRHYLIGCGCADIFRD